MTEEKLEMLKDKIISNENANNSTAETKEKVN